MLLAKSSQALDTESLAVQAGLVQMIDVANALSLAW